jgi:hypothetical protein
MPPQENSRFRLLIGALYLAAGTVILGGVLEGWSYYLSPYHLRPHLAAYGPLRPGGSVGHGYGVVGSALLLLLLLYSVRKRWRRFEALGTPAQWLEVHICFGITGPLLILLHTSLKIQGLVAVSFWSMVAVALSGVFGRWLYLRIPRNIAGQELSRREIADMEQELAARAAEAAQASRPRELARLARERARLERNLRRLEVTRAVFHWWHVVHKPFAVIMLIIMFVHVVVTVGLGYRWVF